MCHLTQKLFSNYVYIWTYKSQKSTAWRTNLTWSRSTEIQCRQKVVHEILGKLTNVPQVESAPNSPLQLKKFQGAVVSTMILEMADKTANRKATMSTILIVWIRPMEAVVRTPPSLTTSTSLLHFLQEEKYMADFHGDFSPGIQLRDVSFMLPYLLHFLSPMVTNFQQSLETKNKIFILS